MWYLLESTHFSVPELHKTGRDLLIYFLTPLTFEREWYTTLRWDGGSTYILKLMTVGLDIYWFIGNRCNLSCVSLFYCYYNGFCSNKIKGLISVNHIFLRNSRLYWQAHTYVVDWPVDRILHDRQNSFSSRAIRMRNSSRTEVVIFWLLRNKNGIKYRKIITSVCK